MNVGQILETHMGWAARGLGLKIDEALDEYRRSGDMTPVRDALKIAYGDEVYNDAFATMDEDQVIEAAGNVTAVSRSRPRSSTAPRRPT
jgi:DNA-directed RNA polymerase subunit beta